MKSNLLIGFIVGAVIVAGGAYYFISKPSATDMGRVAANTETAGETQQQEAKAGAFSGSIQALLGRSGSWKCVIDVKTTQSISAGTTYVSNGKVRGDFTSSVQGYGNIESHMIADGGYAYTWSSVYPQGFKIKLDLSKTNAQGNTGTSGQQSFDVNQNYSYDCQPWSADASLFTVPASVSFKEIGV